MTTLTPRNIEILRIIVEEYIATWEVLWSKLLLKKYNLWVSSATVRNDMAFLEKLELVYQPYNSAWRLPTAKWLRAFVSYLMEQTPEHFLEEENTQNLWKDIRELADFVDNLTFELAKNTREIAFFIVPEKHICTHSGIATFLKKNHKRMGDDIYNIIKMLEDKNNFTKFIQDFPIHDGVNIFIGEENILPYLKDYTIILKPLQVKGDIAYIGIIGGLKMNYSFNISAVRGMI